MLDFGSISPHLLSPTLDFSKKKYTQTTANTTNQYTNTYSPTYMYQIESPNSSQKKADTNAISPTVATKQVPSFSGSSQNPEKGVAGGIDLTGIGVVAVLAVAAIVVMKK